MSAIFQTKARTSFEDEKTLFEATLRSQRTDLLDRTIATPTRSGASAQAASLCVRGVPRGPPPEEKIINIKGRESFSDDAAPTPTRAQPRSGRLSCVEKWLRLRRYDAWTREGILEHYWGEHIHLGYYTDEELSAPAPNEIQGEAPILVSLETYARLETRLRAFFKPLSRAGESREIALERVQFSCIRAKNGPKLAR